MKRGDLYRVYKPAHDEKEFRVFAVVSRQALIDSRFPTLVCARVYTRAAGLSTQVPVGIEGGLKNSSWLLCDDLAGLHKSSLTLFIGSISHSKFRGLDHAFGIVLAIR